MAVSTGVLTKLSRNEAAAMPTLTAITTVADGIKIPMSAEDGRILIMIANGGVAEATATIKKGNALQGVSDLAVTIAAGATKIICVESGRFTNVSGALAGYLLITGSASATLTAGAVALP